jgi:hypothetical protein
MPDAQERTPGHWHDSSCVDRDDNVLDDRNWEAEHAESVWQGNAEPDMTSPDQGGSGALITDHPFTPMKDHPEGCGFYPAKPHDPQGVTSSPCRWPRERHASGAGSTARKGIAGNQEWNDMVQFEEALEDNARLRADLEAAQSEIERQTEELNDLDTKLGAALKALGLEHADLARAQSRIEVLERVADVVRKCWNTSSWCPPEIGEALVAAQAAAETER